MAEQYEDILISLQDVIAEKYAHMKNKYTIIDKQNLHKVIEALEIHYDIDFEEARQYFEDEENENDLEDVLDPNDISESQFYLMFKNYIIKQKAKEESMHGAIATVTDRAQNYQDLAKEESMRGAIVPVTDQAQSDQQLALPSSRIASSKFSSRFDSNSNKIQTALDQRLNPADIFDCMIQACELRVTATQLEALYMMYKREVLDMGVKVTIELFKEVCMNWFSSSNPVLVDQPLERYVLDSILEYTELHKNSNSSEKLVIDTILHNLRAQLNTICPVDTSQLNKPRKLAQGLGNIFTYYAKQHQLSSGQIPSYDNMSKDTKSWNMTKWLKFLRDFKLLEVKSLQETKWILKMEAFDVFKGHCSTSSKTMSKEQFIASCNDLAELYFDSEFDAIYNTQNSQKDISEKRELLWQFLGVYDKTAYRSKMTGLSGHPGTRDKNSFHVPQSFKKKKMLANNPSQKLLPLPKKHNLPPSRSTPKLQPLGLHPQLMDSQEEDLGFLLADDDSSDDEYLTHGYAALGIQPMSTSKQSKGLKNRTFNY